MLCQSRSAIFGHENQQTATALAAGESDRREYLLAESCGCAGRERSRTDDIVAQALTSGGSYISFRVSM
jgi:hypothetical protein